MRPGKDDSKRAFGTVGLALGRRGEESPEGGREVLVPLQPQSWPCSTVMRSRPRDVGESKPDQAPKDISDEGW